MAYVSSTATIVLDNRPSGHQGLILNRLPSAILGKIELILQEYFQPVACRGGLGGRGRLVAKFWLPILVVNSGCQIFSKFPPFGITLRHPFWLTNLKLFLKAPWVPMKLTLRGERVLKKCILFGQSFLKKPKNAFLACFLKIFWQNKVLIVFSVSSENQIDRLKKGPQKSPPPPRKYTAHATVFNIL